MFRYLRRSIGFCLLLTVGISCHSGAQGNAASVVHIEVSGLQKATGSIFIAVYGSESTWLSDDTVLDKKVAIADALDGELVRAELQLPPGEYAFTIFYDRNDNGDLDTNFIGIPKEPIAQSNNAPAKFGPPKYGEAAFTLGSEPLTQQVSMGEL